MCYRSRHDKAAFTCSAGPWREGVSVSTVTLDHVCKVYERGSVTVSVLRDAGLHVASGEFCVIMGPSGSGEKHAAECDCGSRLRDSGVIRLDDQPTDRFSDAEWTRYRRETIGMVFQAFHLVPGLTAAETSGCLYGFRRRLRHLSGNASGRRSSGWGSNIGPGIGPGNYPEGNNNAWPWLAPSSISRASCWRTNPREISTRRPPKRSWRLSGTCPRKHPKPSFVNPFGIGRAGR